MNHLPSLTGLGEQGLDVLPTSCPYGTAPTPKVTMEKNGSSIFSFKNGMALEPTAQPWGDTRDRSHRDQMLVERS